MPNFKDYFGKPIRIGHVLGEWRHPSNSGMGEVIEEPSGEWVLKLFDSPTGLTRHSCNFKDMIVLGHISTWDEYNYLLNLRDKVRQELTDTREHCAENARAVMEYLEYLNTLDEAKAIEIENKIEEKYGDVFAFFKQPGEPIETCLDLIQEDIDKIVKEV